MLHRWRGEGVRVNESGSGRALPRGKVAAIRLHKGFAGEGAPHDAGVSIASAYAPYEYACEELQKGLHGDNKTWESDWTNIV